MKVLNISITVFSILIVFSGCFSTHKPIKYNLSDELNNRIVNPLDKSSSLDVYFITNRKTTSFRPYCGNRYFTVQHGKTTILGVCQVNVPKKHSIGALDNKPGNEDKDTYFKVLKDTFFNEKDFYNAIKQQSGKEIMLLVHGFNVEFQEAVFRAAQVAYDSKFQGPILLFTWPAGADKGFLSSFRMDVTYRKNQQNARKSIQTAAAIIEKLE